MSNRRILFSSMFIVFCLMLPMMTVTTYHSGITDNTTQNKETRIQNNNDEKYDTNQDGDSESPTVYSLTGNAIDEIPDFILESKQEDSGFSEFSLAEIDSNKPNLTAIYYQNMTGGAW